MYNHITKTDIGSTNYINICTEINSAIIKMLIDTGFEYRFPYGLGTLSIYKKDYYRMNKDKTEIVKHYSYINWPETLKAGKHVFFENYHSDGLQYVFRWNKLNNNGRIKHIKWFSLKMSRDNKQYLSKLIKDNKLPFNDFPILQRKCIYTLQ